MSQRQPMTEVGMRVTVRESLELRENLTRLGYSSPSAFLRRVVRREIGKLKNQGLWRPHSSEVGECLRADYGVGPINTEW